MPWFKVDDHFHSHRKVKKCGLEVVGLWTVAGSYCMAHLTDGFVEEWFVKAWPRGMRLAATLVRHGLWVETEKDGEKGWQFHDWDKYQPTKQQVEAEREKARKRKAQQRLSQAESQGESRRDIPGDSQGESRETPGTVPARPTRPSFPSLVDSEGEVTQVAAPGPRPQCSRHPNGNPNDDPCVGCGRVREWDEKNAAAAEADELDRRRRLREIAANCPTCHGTNVVEVSDNEVRKCDHLAVMSG